MTVVVRRRTIAASNAAVWDVLSDFATISAWADNIDHSCLLEDDGGGLGVGSTRRVQTGRTTVVERILECEPPRTLAYAIEGLPPVIRSVRNCWDLAPNGETSTDVSLTSTVEVGPRPPHQIAARVVARLLARQSDTMLAGLADHLEAHRVRPS